MEEGPRPPPDAAEAAEAALAAWAGALRDLAGSLAAHARAIGGGRAGGSRWAAGLQALARAGRELEPPRPGDPARRDVLGLMAAGNSVESAELALAEASARLLDPNIIAAASSGMSRTHDEDLRVAARRIAAAAAAVGGLRRKALAAAALAGGALAAASPTDDLAAAYLAGPPGAPGGAWASYATELYVSALVCRPGPPGAAGVANALEAALGAALGLPADSPAAAAADALALAEYHPIMAMGYSPAFGPALEAPPDSPAVDLSLPQANFNLKYDLSPLIDRRKALSFGPLATRATGLGFRLVERLRTIRSEPRPAAGPPPDERRPPPGGALLGGPLPITQDGGATVSSIPGPRLPGGPPPAAGALWAPFSGCRPRCLRYSSVVEALVLEGIRAGLAAGWGLDLRGGYEKAVAAGAVHAGEYSLPATVAALADAFEAAYDAAPPATPRDFYALAVGEGPSPGDYISRALARIGASVVAERLQAALRSAQQPRTSHGDLEREMWVTQAIHTSDAAKSLWRRIRLFYAVDPAAFARPPALRKPLLLAAFHRIVAAAIAGEPVYGSPPSLKVWAAGLPSFAR